MINHQRLSEIITKLRENDPILKSLILNNQNIDTKSTLSLSHSLMNNTTLTKLNLQSNNIFDKGCISLALILKHNCNLSVLNISDNNINNLGALAMAESLFVNNSLQLLILAANKIGNQGIVALAQSLNVNTIINILGMGANDVDIYNDRVKCAILDASRHNSCLTDVYKQVENKDDLIISEIKDIFEWKKECEVDYFDVPMWPFTYKDYLVNILIILRGELNSSELCWLVIELLKVKSIKS